MASILSTLKRLHSLATPVTIQIHRLTLSAPFVQKDQSVQPRLSPFALAAKIAQLEPPLLQFQSAMSGKIARTTRLRYAQTASTWKPLLELAKIAQLVKFVSLGARPLSAPSLKLIQTRTTTHLTASTSSTFVPRATLVPLQRRRYAIQAARRAIILLKARKIVLNVSSPTHARFLPLETTRGLTAVKCVATIRTQMTKHSASSASPATTALIMMVTTINVQLDLGHLGLPSSAQNAFLDSSAHLQLNRIQMLVFSELMHSTQAKKNVMSAPRTMNALAQLKLHAGMEQESPTNGPLREKVVASFLKPDTNPRTMAAEFTTLQRTLQSYVLLELSLPMLPGIASLALSATNARIRKILRLSARQGRTKIYQGKPHARAAQTLLLLAFNTTHFSELPHAKFAQQVTSVQAPPLCLSSAHGVNTRLKAARTALIAAPVKAGFANLVALCHSHLNQSARRDFTVKETRSFHHRQASISL